jgi:hypothetical protein
MARLILVLAGWLMVAAVAEATVAPRKEMSRLSNDALQLRTIAHPARVQDSQAALAAESPFTLTDQSEVLLNGKPCRYEVVPAHASISLLELAADRHTVLRIHFRTQK